MHAQVAAPSSRSWSTRARRCGSLSGWLMKWAGSAGCTRATWARRAQSAGKLAGVVRLQRVRKPKFPKRTIHGQKGQGLARLSVAAQAPVEQPAAYADGHADCVSHPVAHVGAAVKRGLYELNEAAEGAGTYKHCN